MAARSLACFLVLSLALQQGSFAIRFSEASEKVESSWERSKDDHVDVARVWTYTTLCIPTTSSLLEEHEGRHSCAYNSSVGYRAVGVGYNLDEDVDTRRTELSGVLANYDKVYEGSQCLNDLQINALLALDAKRALDHASDVAKAMGSWCCNVQSSFADITFNAGKDRLKKEDELQDLVEKASSQKWEDAADALEDSEWCEENQNRCKDDADRIREGCSTSHVEAAEVMSVF